MSNPNNKNIAAVIPDIHGCYTLLQEVLEPLYGTGKQLIFLGDLIDRSPEPDGDINVIKLVHKLSQNPEEFGLSNVVVLKGNHEDILLQVKTKDKPYMNQMWLDNGGCYDLYRQVDPYLSWIDSLPIKYKKGKYLFVHAGVRPGVSLAKQKKRDLMWIREDFLDCEDHGLPYTIVHGHSVVGFTDIYKPHNRISLDMGACFGGGLVATELDLSEVFSDTQDLVLAAA